MSLLDRLRANRQLEFFLYEGIPDHSKTYESNASGSAGEKGDENAQGEIIGHIVINYKEERTYFEPVKKQQSDENADEQDDS